MSPRLCCVGRNYELLVLEAQKFLRIWCTPTVGRPQTINQPIKPTTPTNQPITHPPTHPPTHSTNPAQPTKNLPTKSTYHIHPPANLGIPRNPPKPIDQWEKIEDHAGSKCTGRPALVVSKIQTQIYVLLFATVVLRPTPQRGIYMAARKAPSASHPRPSPPPQNRNKEKEEEKHLGDPT